jgi:hypothetical protein
MVQHSIFCEAATEVLHVIRGTPVVKGLSGRGLLF